MIKMKMTRIPVCAVWYWRQSHLGAISLSQVNCVVLICHFLTNRHKTKTKTKTTPSRSHKCTGLSFSAISWVSYRLTIAIIVSTIVTTIAIILIIMDEINNDSKVSIIATFWWSLMSSSYNHDHLVVVVLPVSMLMWILLHWSEAGTNICWPVL